VIVLKTKTYLSMRAEGKERRYIQRPPGLDGDVGIMSRPPQHKHPFPPESRTRQRNPIQQSPEHVDETYWRRAAAATTYLIYPTNHKKRNRKNRR